MKYLFQILAVGIIALMVAASAVLAAILVNTPATNALPTLAPTPVSTATQRAITLNVGETFYRVDVRGQRFNLTSTAGLPPFVNMELQSEDSFFFIYLDDDQIIGQSISQDSDKGYFVFHTETPCYMQAGNIFLTILWQNKKLSIFEGQQTSEKCPTSIG